MTGQHLITTIARADTCPRCQAPTLTGLDAGAPYAVDAEPIPPNIEWLILLTGLWTYNRHPVGEIWRRDQWIIAAGKPANGITIHAQHPCSRRKEQEHK